MTLDLARPRATPWLDPAAGTTIRVATKSIRMRAVIDAALALPGFAPALACTLPEALWLAEKIADVAGDPTYRGEGWAFL